MIVLKVFLVLCVAEIYQVAIMAGVNWSNKTKFELYKFLVPKDSNPPSMNDSKIKKKTRADYIRGLIAACGISLFLGFKTVWFLW